MTEEKKVATVSETIEEKETVRTVVVVQQSSVTGVFALVFAFLSFFVFSLIFIPLAIIFSVIAIIKGSKTPVGAGGAGLVPMGILSLILAGFSAVNSPFLLILLAVITGGRL